MPSYNPGPRVYDTVAAARASLAAGVGRGRRQHRRHRRKASLALAARTTGPARLVLPRNQGKGAAVLHGLRRPLRRRLHPCAHDGLGRPASGRTASPPSWPRRAPARTAMILGEPVFDASAPLLRVRGRRISNSWANLETLWGGIGDSLFGFRVYPVAPLLAVMRAPALDAPLRLRCRGGGAAGLARRAAAQPRGAGAVSQRRARAGSRISATGATTRC